MDDAENREPAAEERDFAWPAALEQGRVADRAFAAAYASVADRQRAWIKTGVAALFAALGGPMPLRSRRELALGHDLSLVCAESPCDFALIVCGPGFASPARLAAAVLPALCARVPAVAAVRVGAAWPKPLLTTLELCGVESVFRMGRRSFAELGRVLAGAGHGAVVLLDGVRTPGDWPATLRLLPARVRGRAGVFPSPDGAFDYEALAFAQPDLRLGIHGATVPEGSVFEPAAGGLAEAAGLGYDALYVTASGREAALAAAPLVLGPGRESLWLWPELPPAIFRRQGLAASVLA